MYKKELITVLREAARKIESGEEYSWGDPARCNCGFVTQVALDILPNPLTLKLKKQDMHGSWTESAKMYCPTTGIPLTTIFKKLAKLGLKQKDFEYLEYLSNPKVQEEAGLAFNDDHTDSQNVVKYMRVWADQIELELKSHDTKKKTKSRLHRLAKSVLADASKPTPSIKQKKASETGYRKKTVKRRIAR